MADMSAVPCLAYSWSNVTRATWTDCSGALARAASSRQCCKLPGGLLVAPALVRGIGGQEPRLETLPVLHGRSGHPFGELVVATLARGLGPGEQERRAPFSPHELERGQEDRVVLAAPTGCFRELAHQKALPSWVDAGAHHVAVDGMGQTHLQAASIHAAGEQAPVLERLDRGGVGQLVERGLRQWLAQGRELHRMPLRFGQRSQALRDDVVEACGRDERTAQSPDPVLLP